MDVSFPRTIALQIARDEHPTIRLVSDTRNDDGTHTIVATNGTTTIRTNYVGTTDNAWHDLREVTFTID